ncbi:MAG: hypothetical protein ACRDHF_16925 [Tepidiformaceae bacterium]
MIAKAVVVTVLVLCALSAPWMTGEGVAAPIPGYFSDGWVGFACLNAVVAGGSPTPVLVQLNFDKVAGSGISLARADSLFARLTGSLGWLSQLTGASLQLTCAHTPGQIQAGVAGLTALQAAQQLSGTFQQRGFSSYLILDSFFSVAPSYLGDDIAILRTDAFRVVGANNVTYIGSTESLESLTP